MKILIAGDFFVSDKFKNKKLIDESIVDLFSESDYRILNLEAPLTKNAKNNKIYKTGPNIRMSEEIAIPILKRLNVDIVTLANNHILDYGEEGLIDTFNCLNYNNIGYVGAGNNIVNARKCITIEKDGLKVAILNFCESEWSIADEENCGANPLDVINNSNDIINAKINHDKVICIIHGGNEFYNLPNPRIQKQYRYYIDQGADLIVSHHTHCISGYEVYKNAPIYYNLGNFIFTLNMKNKDWYNGLILEIDLFNNQIKHKVHPIKQEREFFNTYLLKNDAKINIIQHFNELSCIIANKEQLLKNWTTYVDKETSYYLRFWSPFVFIKNKYISYGLNKVFGKLIRKKGRALYLNLIRCESHKDISIDVLEKYINKNNNS